MRSFGHRRAVSSVELRSVSPPGGTEGAHRHLEPDLRRSLENLTALPDPQVHLRPGRHLGRARWTNCGGSSKSIPSASLPPRRMWTVDPGPAHVLDNSSRFTLWWQYVASG